MDSKRQVPVNITFDNWSQLTEKGSV